MAFNFESLLGGKKTENGEGNKVSIENAGEIFGMFDDANVALTSEARDIITQATAVGYIERENLERLLELIKEADNADE
jgi:hypothetical protein